MSHSRTFQYLFGEWDIRGLDADLYGTYICLIISITSAQPGALCLVSLVLIQLHVFYKRHGTSRSTLISLGVPILLKGAGMGRIQRIRWFRTSDGKSVMLNPIGQLHYFLWGSIQSGSALVFTHLYLVPQNAHFDVYRFLPGRWPWSRSPSFSLSKAFRAISQAQS